MARGFCPCQSRLVLTEFESVTLILVDWLLKGYDNKFWGGAAPPESLTWLPQRYRVTPISDLKSYRASLVKKAEAKSKTEESRSIHQFWSGAVIPPGVKRIVNKKHDVTVSVNQLAGLISQLSDQVQARGRLSKTRGSGPTRYLKIGSELPSWSSSRGILPRVPFQAGRDSMLLTKPPGVITFQVHPVSRRMAWGLTILKGVCSKLVKNIKKITTSGQRDA